MGAVEAHHLKYAYYGMPVKFELAKRFLLIPRCLLILILKIAHVSLWAERKHILLGVLRQDAC